MKYKKVSYITIASWSACIYPITFIVPPQEEIPAALVHSRKPSLPYITGDAFRSIAKFKIDEKKIPFDPNEVQNGDIIFVRSHTIEFFFSTIHPHIKKRYILISHNSDHPAPARCARYLDDEKLIAWFGQNGDITYHPKFFPIPIGLANAYWPIHGNATTVTQVRATLSEYPKKFLLYINFEHTHPTRARARKLFEHKSFCHTAAHRPYDKYLQDMAHSKFVLCPRGNGLDCHRPWEALLMGAIPVVEESTIDPLFDKLPVLKVKNFEVITEQFLHEAYAAMQRQTFEYERILANYWLEKILETKKKYGQLS